ncbi:hypothetical protein V2G26_004052 [Clonostachys chloroleuca]
MLGLAASHLCLSGRGDHEAEALEHRVKSIKLLNQALCKPPTSKTESDARFSTLMVLTFQSSYMPDGMLEIFHMIRGCMILTRSTLPKYAMSLFTKFASGEVTRKSMKSQKTVHSQRLYFLPMLPPRSNYCGICVALSSRNNISVF